MRMFGAREIYLSNCQMVKLLEMQNASVAMCSNKTM